MREFGYKQIIRGQSARWKNAHENAHRYIFLVYEQPHNTRLRDEFYNHNRTKFNLTAFVHDRHLAGPVAGNFFHLHD
ncbi:hypothetical protein CDAR_520551 [Caerostris darwini]|uniref:Uncharacterized protein n=1 Tax=Caerostris darwini TaxID=1538125 RepID=A0AAV4W9W6_9ARAC|nr:hypothetical protein CDAR_520551 [Caerostris darwini]